MIDIPAKIKDAFFGNADGDELLEVLKCTINLVEEMLPWLYDGRLLRGRNSEKYLF